MIGRQRDYLLFAPREDQLLLISAANALLREGVITTATAIDAINGALGI